MPPADLAAWRRATGPSDSLLGEASRAAKWSPATLRHRQEAVEVFVHFLRRQGHTDIPSVVPLVTPAVLDAFVADQCGRGNRGSTIAKRLESLHAALGLIAPSENFAFILRPGGLPLRRRLDTRPQPVEVHDTVDIIHRVHAQQREGLNGIG